MENIIYEISLFTDYKTTIKLLQLYPRIFNRYNNIWKLKCQKQYSNRPYFDLWTGAENYLMCTKQKFMLILYDIEYSSENLPYIYEYDKMLKDIYNIRLCSCHIDDDINLKSLNLYNINSKFIIITTQIEYKPIFINSYNTLDECIKWINECDNPDFWNKCNIYIIDLNKMIPVFWGKKKRNHDNPKSSQHISYYKFINNKLTELIPESYCL